jgi:DNA-binding response OmpR family regulator
VGTDTDVTSKQVRNLAILIVDDEVPIGELLSEMFSDDGHKTTICFDGLSALSELSGQKFDLMITDLGLPGMSGLELCGRAHEQFPALHIAMITGWGDQLNQKELSTNGVKAILSKPFNLKDIKALVGALAVG